MRIRLPFIWRSESEKRDREWRGWADEYRQQLKKENEGERKELERLLSACWTAKAERDPDTARFRMLLEIDPLVLSHSIYEADLVRVLAREMGRNVERELASVNIGAVLSGQPIKPLGRLQT